MNDIPSKARVVIIGGGVIGCSVAYPPAKLAGATSFCSNESG